MQISKTLANAVQLDAVSELVIFYTEKWEAYHQIYIIIRIEFQVAQGGAVLHPRRHDAQRLKVLWIDTYKRQDIRVFQMLPNQSLSTEFLW